MAKRKVLSEPEKVLKKMYNKIKSGEARLRPFSKITNSKERGCNKNYIRSWFYFGK